MACAVSAVEHLESAVDSCDSLYTTTAASIQAFVEAHIGDAVFVKDGFCLRYRDASVYPTLHMVDVALDVTGGGIKVDCVSFKISFNSALVNVSANSSRKHECGFRRTYERTPMFQPNAFVRRVLIAAEEGGFFDAVVRLNA